MAFIRFTKCDVEIDGTAVYATSASMAESMPLQRINALGWKGAVAVSVSGPPEGTWNADWTYVDGNNGFLTTFKKNWDDKISVKLASATMTACIMTSLSFSAEANGIVTCSAAGNFYNSLGGSDDFGAGTEGGPKTAAEYVDVGHGSKSNVVGASTDSFNFNWEASRSLTSIYALNDAFPIHLDFSDETITATAQGSNLQNALVKGGGPGQGGDYTSICPNTAALTFSIGGLCGDFAGQELDCDGFVQDHNVEVTEGDVLRGNVTVVDYYNAATD